MGILEEGIKLRSVHKFSTPEGVYGYEVGAREQGAYVIDKSWNYIQGIIDYASNGGDITHITKDDFINYLNNK